MAKQVCGIGNAYNRHAYLVTNASPTTLNIWFSMPIIIGVPFKKQLVFMTCHVGLTECWVTTSIVISRQLICVEWWIGWATLNKLFSVAISTHHKVRFWYKSTWNATILRSGLLAHKDVSGLRKPCPNTQYSILNTSVCVPLSTMAKTFWFFLIALLYTSL